MSQQSENYLLKRISKAALQFLVQLTPEETYNTIISEALALAKGDEGVIILNRKDHLEPVYTKPSNITRIKPRKKGFAYKALNTGQSFLVHENMFGKVHPEIPQKVKTSLFIPLSYESQHIGVLVIRFFEHKTLSADILEALNLYGSLASINIHKMQLYADVQKAVVLRDLFIAIASHELKTPLTTITMYVQLLQSRMREERPFEEKWINNLSMETTRLSNLINELLQLDQIERGQLHFTSKTCSMKSILKRAVNDFKMLHPSYQVTVQDKTDGNDIFVCDYDKILQVVINLLNNAAKFSDIKKEITLSLSKKKGMLCLRIEDKGQGIPKRDLPRIFEQFYKGTSHNKDGMGIGLFLTKNIIEHHGGYISIESQLHKGTAVEVHLPL